MAGPPPEWRPRRSPPGGQSRSHPTTPLSATPHRNRPLLRRAKAPEDRPSRNAPCTRPCGAGSHDLTVCGRWGVPLHAPWSPSISSQRGGPGAAQARVRRPNLHLGRGQGDDTADLVAPQAREAREGDGTLRTRRAATRGVAMARPRARRLGRVRLGLPRRCTKRRGPDLAGTGAGTRDGWRTDPRRTTGRGTAPRSPDAPSAEGAVGARRGRAGLRLRIRVSPQTA